MTDKDRYGTSLGKVFHDRVRAALCSDDPESMDAAEKLASYLYRQLRKDVKDLRDVLVSICRVFTTQIGFFDVDNARHDFEHRLVGSLGGEHILAALEMAIRHGTSFQHFVDNLSKKAITVTRTRLQHQSNYKNDVLCQERFDKYAAASSVALQHLLLQASGLAKARHVKTKSDTRSLLEAPVVVK